MSSLTRLSIRTQRPLPRYSFALCAQLPSLTSISLVSTQTRDPTPDIPPLSLLTRLKKLRLCSLDTWDLDWYKKQYCNADPPFMSHKVFLLLLLILFLHLLLGSHHTLPLLRVNENESFMIKSDKTKSSPNGSTQRLDFKMASRALCKTSRSCATRAS